MVNKGPKILVAGAGAIGTAIAARLQYLGCPVIFIGRKRPLKGQFRFSGWDKLFWLDTEKLEDVDLSEVALTFFTVKAFDLEGAIRRFIKYVPKQSVVVPLSNGYTEPMIRLLAKEYPEHHWRNGFCTFGVSQTDEGCYQLRSTGGGAIFGPLSGQNTEKAQVSPIENSLFQADQQQFFHWHDPIGPSQHMKWLFNTVLNTLCGVFRLPNNGMVLEKVPLARALTSEAYKLGVELWGPWNVGEEKVFEDLIALVTATAQNENSMARDIRLGQRNETEWLAGVVGKRVGYPLLHEYNSHLLALNKKSTDRR